MFDFFQILILLLFCSAILFFFLNKVLRYFLILIFSLLISLQCFSYYYGGSLIDYKFFQHFNFNDIADSSLFFWKEGIGFFALMIFFILFFNFIYVKFVSITKTKYLISFALLAFVILNISDGAFNNFYKIFQLNSIKDVSLDSALRELNIDPTEYIYSEDVEATKGKNIIVISLESYEKGFLEKGLKNLTPNLSAFKNKYNYFEMNQGNGSNWTAGSMYTYITGMPMFFKGTGNSIFQNSIGASITGISHVLNKAGYNQKYLIGKSSFSGIDDLLKTYEINCYPQTYYNNKYEEGSFGIHDFDLFTEAKEQVSKFKDLDEPFALYISTISTHFPNGIYDERMESKISKKDSDLEFMIASVDFMINDFIEHLNNLGLLENTVFYIFPDHLLMGKSPSVLSKIKKRGLFLLSNAEKENLNIIDKDKPIEQIDLPKIILNGAEIKHNAKFLADYISGDKNDFINKNKEKILALNQASIKINGFNKDFKISVKSFLDSLTINTIKIKSQDEKLNFETDSFTIKDFRYHAFIFDEYMRVTHRKSKNNKLFNNNFEDKINVLIDIQNVDSINVFIRKGGILSKVAHYSESEIEISSNDINNLKLLKAYDFRNKTLVNDKFFKINNPRGILYITSSSDDLSNSIPTAIELNNNKLKHKRGLNIIDLDNPYKIEEFKIYKNNSEINKFINRIKILKEKNKDFVIIADNPVKIESVNFRMELRFLGLNKLASIRDGYAYVCYSEGIMSLEKMDPKTISIQVNINNNQKIRSKSELYNIKNDVSRYIAHAAGEIEGYTYTNSLEALNSNYEKGFRFFELDIIKTDDNKFVAAHDWKYWKKNTYYKLENSISLETFMNAKIYNKFSPLSMKEINNWFYNHKDAILITDKVNTPKEFADKFIDKNRLMMELFTDEAVIEANKHKIKFLAAPKVFKGKNHKEKLKFIDDNNIKYMTVSRRTIDRNRTYYKKLNEKGLKIYAFNISFGNWYDEKYVFLNEMEFIYGMYTDKWSF